MRLALCAGGKGSRQLAESSKRYGGSSRQMAVGRRKRTSPVHYSTTQGTRTADSRQQSDGRRPKGNRTGGRGRAWNAEWGGVKRNSPRSEQTEVRDRYSTDGPASSGHTRTSRPRAHKIGAAICCNLTTRRTLCGKGSAANRCRRRSFAAKRRAISGLRVFTVSISPACRLGLR